MDVQKEFENLVEATLEDLGGTLEATKEELAAYGAERAQKLADIIDAGEPGFDQAVVAARNSMALKAGLVAGDAAGAVDSVWRGVFSGALRMAAMSLVGLPPT